MYSVFPLKISIFLFSMYLIYKILLNYPRQAWSEAIVGSLFEHVYQSLFRIISGPFKFYDLNTNSKLITQKVMIGLHLLTRIFRSMMNVNYYQKLFQLHYFIVMVFWYATPNKLLNWTSLADFVISFPSCLPISYIFKLSCFNVLVTRLTDSCLAINKSLNSYVFLFMFILFCIYFCFYLYWTCIRPGITIWSIGRGKKGIYK